MEDGTNILTPEGGNLVMSIFVGVVIWLPIYNWISDKIWGKDNDDMPGWYHAISYLSLAVIIVIINKIATI